ncbi:MAG: glycosyl transferase [Deltaproteobacteria bacterium RIFCSPLOWO2_02_FULL_53_8]|nr:MAG: glycosyl transferase [Deltaproteobacteria bacterium RIFCSPLOWO2_02_FULL_53_8]
MKLSIVATLYQSASHIVEFHARTTATAREFAGDDYELILVNDGSPDNSLDVAVELIKRDSHVIVVDLSRNFGHHKAMMTGLANTKGDSVFLIDSDLEERPEYLLEFSAKKEAEACDVVYGVQNQRKGRTFERLSGKFFWWFFNLITGMNLPANIATVRLMSRRYVDSLVSHQEREIFMAGLWHITGFNQVPIPINKISSGATTYTFRKKMALLINSVTSFSNAPLVSIFYLGMIISLVAFFYILYLIGHWTFLDRPVSGWTSVMASIWMLGGLLMSSVGIVGIYLSKIFSETKQRPYTIIRKIYKETC